MDIFNKKTFLVLAITIFNLSFFNFSHAQTAPQFMVSWEASNYAPSWYEGKILPTANSKITVSFELINNGKPADLSDTKVRWYINDKLVKNEVNGLGIKKITFLAPNYFGQPVDVRIAVVDFAGGGLIDKLLEIPVVRPEAVINVPYKNNEIKTGNLIFNVLPFFFNTNNNENFSVQWSVLGQEPATPKGDPFAVNLKIDSQMPSGSTVNLSVAMSNILKAIESASDSVNLTIK